MELADTEPPQRSWWARHSTNVATALVTATLVAGIAVLAWAIFLRPDIWDPLGEYPPQTISTADTDPLDGLPVAYLDEPSVITSEGTKCNDSDEPVDVAAQSAWTSIEPRGYSVPNSTGNTTRQPGCIPELYSNEINPELKAKTLEILELEPHRDRVVWSLGGQEQPTRPDGTTGARRTWQTDALSLRPTR